MQYPRSLLHGTGRRLLVLQLGHLVEHVLVLVLHQELRAALDVHKQAVRAADVLHLHRRRPPLGGHQRGRRDEVDGVPQRRLRPDLRQQLLCVVCSPT